MNNAMNLDQPSGSPRQLRHACSALVGIALMVALLCVASSRVQAQTSTEDASSGAIQLFAIIHGHDESATGSWNSNDEARLQELRARLGQDFAWFRRGGAEFVITDAAVLKELDAAMEPQRKVNRMQAEVNALQARVNAMQAKVNAHQQLVNASQQEVSRRPRLESGAQSAPGGRDEKVTQEAVDRQQAAVNREQTDVNAEQSKVNAQQTGVNLEQKRASEQVKRAVQEVFARSLKSGMARQVH